MFLGSKRSCVFVLRGLPLVVRVKVQIFCFLGFFNPNLFNIIIPASVGKHFVKLMVKTSRLNVIRQHYFKYVCYDILVFDKYLNTSISFALKAMYWYLFFYDINTFSIFGQKVKVRKMYLYIKWISHRKNHWLIQPL